jgi:EAL domain-containing protein (putative c-di-GMP-specific phosphodiesterase class I)/GGDEF domain-containing protein
MKSPAVGRNFRAALVGITAVALQQWPISYEIELYGAHASASLAHLHAGLLLALAMAFRDRIYLRTAFVCVFIGWQFRAVMNDYSGIQLAMGLPFQLSMYFWTIWCARLIGWPPATSREVSRNDIARFALVGLMLYPVGWSLLDLVINWFDPAMPLSASVNDAVQVFFAKHFGVSVVTLPLLLLINEQPRPRCERLSVVDGLIWGLLLAGVGVTLFIALVLHNVNPEGFGLVTAILDYRFALVAVLTWCALRMNLRLVMPLLIAVQLLLVVALAKTSPHVEGTFGLLGLLKVAFELSVLQLLIVVLLLMQRDGETLLDHLREESQREAITGLRNLNGLRAQLQHMRLTPHEIAYLSLANLDRLAGGFGLRAQEALMQDVAAHLSGCVDCYHMGVGQFALLARRAGPTTWSDVLNRLEHYDFHYAGETLRLTPYLGVAALDGASRQQIDAALDAASTAAQDAALRGETAPVRARLAMVSGASMASRDALALGSLALARVQAREVELFFQPIKRLDEPADQPIRYGEILCRLRDDNGKLLMPGAFIRELEARSRSAELDIAVIDCLFDTLRALPNGIGSLRLGVNLTGRSLLSDRFRGFVLGELDRAPLAPSSLCFEITESEAIAHFGDARRLLDELRQRGCLIALDDFGVGMQSFERLRELPFDVIKIDGSFVRGVTARARDYELVRASVAVARACGADVIAEYVENAEIAACLRELDVPWGQGHHFGDAVPLPQILRKGILVS